MNPADWHSIRNKIGRDYYIVGNEYITGVVQIDRGGPGGAVCLLVQDPHYFGLHWVNKEQTYLFDPKKGLEDTQLTVTLDGRKFQPVRFNVKEQWREGNQPILDVRWWAGFVRVTETFFASTTQPVLCRRVTLENRGRDETRVGALLPFLPNEKQFNVPQVMGNMTCGNGDVGWLGMSLVESEHLVTEVKDTRVAFHRAGFAPGDTCTATFVHAFAKTKEAVVTALGTVAKGGGDREIKRAATGASDALQLKCEDRDVMVCEDKSWRPQAAAFSCVQ